MDAHSILPALCANGLKADMSITSSKKYAFAANCELADQLKMLQADSAFAVPSIQFVRFEQVALSLDYDAESGMATTAYGGSAAFKLATCSTLGTASCETTDPAAEPGCLRAQVSLAAVKEPTSTSVAFTASFGGVWIEPLGLKNFALQSPNVAMALTLGSWPKEISWDLTMYHKESDSYVWPSSVYSYYPGAMNDPGVTSVSSKFLFQMLPHDDTALTLIGCPRFAIMIDANPQVLQNSP